MEHLCHRCGVSVEDGIPFCPSCNAPQIRVSGGAASLNAPLPHPPGMPEDLQPPAQPVALHDLLPRAIDWRAGLPAALQAGVITGVLSSLPFISLLFLVWMLLDGFLGVTFYRRRRPTAPITAGMGARLGVVSSLFGFGSFVATTATEIALQTLVLRQPNVLREQILQAIQQSSANAADPESQRMLEALKSPAGITALFVVGLVLFFIGFFLLGALGGAIGGHLARRQDSR